MNRLLDGSVGINNLAELLGAGNSGEETICQIKLLELHPFKDHPFKVVDDEKMKEMAEALKNGGKIIVPGIVRPISDGG